MSAQKSTASAAQSSYEDQQHARAWRRNEVGLGPCDCGAMLFFTHTQIEDHPERCACVVVHRRHAESRQINPCDRVASVDAKERVFGV